jgi:Rit1 DUSP-like domain
MRSATPLSTFCGFMPRFKGERTVLKTMIILIPMYLLPPRSSPNTDPKTPDMERIQPLPRHTSASTRHFSAIIPERIWIADQTAGTHEFTLQHLSITHVVCIGDLRYHAFCPDFHLATHYRFVVPMDPNALRLDIFDDIVTSIREVYSEDNSSRILVHCANGMDFSAAIAIACLMGVNSRTYEEAHDDIGKCIAVCLDPMLVKIITQWWDLEKSRLSFPVGRGYRTIEWTV